MGKLILLEGHSSDGDHLVWTWHKKEYLGAAHGTAGILSVLFAAEFRTESMFRTLEWLSKQKTPSGNYKTRPGNEVDKLSQWCHGSAGIGLLYAQLAGFLPKRSTKHWNQSYQRRGKTRAEFFHTVPDPHYLRLAEECGEHLTQYGFLKKGISLCHGSSGNAILFLQLYRLTQNKKWLEWAWRFATFLSEPENRSLWKQADQPYCFANGLAGAAFFYHLLDKKKNSWITPVHPLFQMNPFERNLYIQE